MEALNELGQIAMLPIVALGHGTPPAANTKPMSTSLALDIKDGTYVRVHPQELYLDCTFEHKITLESFYDHELIVRSIDIKQGQGPVYHLVSSLQVAWRLDQVAVSNLSLWEELRNNREAHFGTAQSIRRAHILFAKHEHILLPDPRRRMAVQDIDRFKISFPMLPVTRLPTPGTSEYGQGKWVKVALGEIYYDRHVRHKVVGDGAKELRAQEMVIWGLLDRNDAEVIYALVSTIHLRPLWFDHGLKPFISNDQLFGHIMGKRLFFAKGEDIRPPDEGFPETLVKMTEIRPFPTAWSEVFGNQVTEPPVNRFYN